MKLFVVDKFNIWRRRTLYVRLSPIFDFAEIGKTEACCYTCRQVMISIADFMQLEDLRTTLECKDVMIPLITSWSSQRATSIPCSAHATL